MDALKKWWAPIFESIGWRWGVVIAAGITLPSYLHRWAREHSMTALPDLDWTLGGIIFAAIVVLWRLRLYAANLLDRLEPKFRVSFNRDSNDITLEPVTRSVEGRPRPTTERGKATYVRIRVDALANAPVHKCKAFITGISKRKATESLFKEFPLSDNISIYPDIDHGQAQDSDFDVFPEIAKKLTLLISNDNTSTLERALNINWPLRSDDLLTSVGVYRFKIAVYGAGSTRSVIAEIHWNGKWNEIEGREVETLL
jgi:hypothetical protein